jgi:predicted nucleotidyltransferase component of viral defense system
MLEPQDLAEVGATFGVAEQQVRRDHLIGHMLAALATLDEPSMVFFGGTALTWTHLPTGRLSEDIDLFVVGRARVAATIESTLPRRLRREFPAPPGLRHRQPSAP